MNPSSILQENLISKTLLLSFQRKDTDINEINMSPEGGKTKK